MVRTRPACRVPPGAMLEPKLVSSAVRCWAFTGPGPPSPTLCSWARKGVTRAQSATTTAQAAANGWERDLRIVITLDCRLICAASTGRKCQSLVTAASRSAQVCAAVFDHDAAIHDDADA